MTTLLMLSYIALTLITIAIYYKYFDKEAKKRREKQRRAYLEQPWEIRSTRPELKNY
jgi:cbb3-type cytochrome oxidase subunit 3